MGNWNDLSSDLIFPNDTLSVEGKEQASMKSTNSSSTYTVKSGDTLFKIASAHGISLDQLMSWNNLSGHMIYPGQEFAVKGAAAKVEAPAAKEAPKSTPAAAKPAAASTQSGKEMTVSATAYTAYCAGCSGITRTGIDLRSNPNQKVIAVEPSVIPLGSKVWVEGYGTAIA